MRRPSRILAAVAILVSVVASITAVARAASAQDQAPAVSIVTAVDATSSEVEVTVLRSDYDVAASDVSIAAGGSDVEVAAVETARSVSRPTEVVFVLDVDNRIKGDGTLNAVTETLTELVADLPAEVHIGLVTAGEQADLRTRLTADRDRVTADLRGIPVERGAAIVDAVRLAADTFSERSGVVRSIVVVSAGLDTASESTVAEAEAPLIQQGIQLLALERADSGPEVDRMVARTGGVGLALADLEMAAEQVTAATTIATDRLLVSFNDESEAGARKDVSLSIAGQPVGFSYAVGSETITRLQLDPTAAAESDGIGLFGQPIVLYISLVLAFLAISAGVWALASMFAGGDTSLDSVLARYSDRDESLEDDQVEEMLVQTALIRRVADMTETFAESRGFLTRVEELLERANLPVRAGEALVFLSALVVFVFGGVFVITGTPFMAAVVALVTAFVGYAIVQFLAKRRLKQFDAQLPDALQLLAGTLRAGYSLPQGLDAVSDEIADPMGQELRRAITETQLGRELEDALAGIAERLDSPDFAWAVMAIGIQREVGGNLAELLLTVSDTMIQRERLRREVNSLTAEGRVSAGILSMMPPGLGLVMWVMNPQYIEVLFSRRIGLAMLGLAVVSGLIGLVWMKKVITIDA